MKNNSEINFYVDSLIVETILSNDLMSKIAQAGLISSLKDKIVHYVGNNIDPNDKAGSILNILAPGAISVAFSAMGLGWLGMLFGLAMKIFHIDVKGILSSIYNKIKGAIGGGKQMTSSEVDNIVNGAVQEHNTPATEEEFNAAESMMKSKSASVTLRDAKILKLAMIEYEQVLLGIKKEAGLLSIFGGNKTKTITLLGKVLSYIFKIALAAAGIMVAGDVANKMLGRPNALDDTVQHGKPVSAPTNVSSMPVHVATQTKFPINPGYKNEIKNNNKAWSESISNDDASIEAMLINFAKQVYQGLNGLETLIRKSPEFQAVKSNISFYNRAASGDPIVFIPQNFTSKKQIVDEFIDEVAEKAP